MKHVGARRHVRPYSPAPRKSVLQNRCRKDQALSPNRCARPSDPELLAMVPSLGLESAGRAHRVLEDGATARTNLASVEVVRVRSVRDAVL